MGTIQSGVGLISGIDIESVVSQLMEIEKRPLNLIQERIVKTQAEQQAYSLLNVSLDASETALKTLASNSSFRVKKATSSNPDVLSVTASSSAPIDSFNFLVKSLVSTHQIVSTRGFADRDSTPVGAGTLSFKSRAARLAVDTDLRMFNDGQGVSRGQIRITDGSGSTATVDLRTAVTVNDVLDAINSSGLSIAARASGDGLVVEDLSGGGGNLVISDLNGGSTAEELGILGSSSTGTLGGADLIDLSQYTALNHLNDGVGVRFDGKLEDLQITLGNGREFKINLTDNFAVSGFRTSLAELNNGNGVGSGTIRITNKNGDSVELTLTGEETFGELNQMITDANPDLAVQITGLSSSGSFAVIDSSGGTAGNLKIEDVSGNVAELLGIAGESEPDQRSIAGQANYRLDTLGAVMRKIEQARDTDGNANNGDLTVELVDNHLRLTDNTGSGGQVVALNGSSAARDLGLLEGFDGSGTIETRDLIAGPNTVLLSSLLGGNGVQLGTASFTRRDGTNTGPIDFSQAQTLQDVMDLINAQDGLKAGVTQGGLGIEIIDTTAGSGSLMIEGTGLNGLNLRSDSDDRLSSGDLHKLYITEKTLLSELNGGNGIEYGDFQISDSGGSTATVSLREGVHNTLGDVIAAINGAGIGVTAGLNDTGDGIALQDTAGGGGILKVADLGATETASDLRIAAESDTGTISANYGGSIEIGPGDTLDDLVTKINESNNGVRASVINDGSAVNPYKLIITSATTGREGQVAFDAGSTGIDFSTLSEARDAVMIIGDPDSASNLVISSSSNTITDAVDGLKLNLLSTSDQPVQVSVDRDIDAVVEDIGTFVETFNATLGRIEELTRFDPETFERGVLFSDSTVYTIRTRLLNTVRANTNDSSMDYSNLVQVGITVGEGTRLQFDEQRFREEFEKDPDEVRRLFTEIRKDDDDEDKIIPVGIGARLKEEFDDITNSFDGLIADKNRRLQDKIDLYDDRASDMQKLLDIKEERLYAEFQAMEAALADMQAQQTALTSLANLASSMAL